MIIGLFKWGLICSLFIQISMNVVRTFFIIATAMQRVLITKVHISADVKMVLMEQELSAQVKSSALMH